jgi:hypothetical protein
MASPPVLSLAYPDLTSCIFSGSGIPAAGVADEAVSCHAATFEDQSPVSRDVSSRPQALQRQAVDRALTSGAVNPHIAGLIEPMPTQPEQIVSQSVVTHPGPEVLAHVADPVLGLALGLGPVSMTKPRLKAVVLREVEQPRVEDGSPRSSSRSQTVLVRS